MQIYVKLFAICHHAPIKTVYMTFRKKWHLLIRVWFCISVALIALGLPNAAATDTQSQGLCEHLTELLVVSPEFSRTIPVSGLWLLSSMLVPFRRNTAWRWNNGQEHPCLSSGSWRFPTNKNGASRGLASLDQQKGDHLVFNLCAFLFLDDYTQRGKPHFLLLLCYSVAVEMPTSWLIEYSEHNRDRWLIFRLICLVFQMTLAYSLAAPGMPPLCVCF